MDDISKTKWKKSVIDQFDEWHKRVQLQQSSMENAPLLKQRMIYSIERYSRTKDAANLELFITPSFSVLNKP